MEFFRNANIDFLGKKWYFIAFSLIFSIAGVCSMLFWHGIPLGIDFRGGTLVYVKFSHAPDDNAIRTKMGHAGLANVRIQTYGSAGSNEVLIDVPQANEQAGIDRPKEQIVAALGGSAPEGKRSLNFGRTTAVAYDSTREQILVPN